MKKALLLILISLLISCTFSSKEENEPREKTAYPDLVLENAEYLLGQSNERPIVVRGERITFYSKDNRAELERFSFSQEDEEGNIILQGSADEGLINTKSKTMDLKGNVFLEKPGEGMEIHAENLFFDSESEEAKADGKVVVKSKDGEFSGTDFYGDLRNMVYSFSEMEDGKIKI